MNTIGALLTIGLTIAGFCLLAILVLFTIRVCKGIVEEADLNELFKRKSKKN